MLQRIRASLRGPFVKSGATIKVVRPMMLASSRQQLPAVALRSFHAAAEAKKADAEKPAEKTDKKKPVKNRVQNIAFIGCGMMGEAMVAGLLRKKNFAPQNIYVTDTRPSRLEELEAAYPGVIATANNVEAVSNSQIVVLCVKPQDIKTTLPALRGHLENADLLVSIAAGVSLDQIADGACHAAVVRAMPNTPGQIGKGITVWVGADLAAHHTDEVNTVLKSMGEVIEVSKEGQLDIATALSGSGPGYVFLMMEAMIDAGVHLGFSRRVAEQLVLSTVKGSVEYAEQSDKHIAALRNQVTSPGGTTAEALYYLERGNIRNVLSRGVFAAYKKSKALGKEQAADSKP